jgi:predicted small secreted protein
MKLSKRARREIMEIAHKIAKKLEGDYSVRLKMALQIVWKAVKEESAIVGVKINKQKEWKNYGKHRMYYEGEVTYVVFHDTLNCLYMHTKRMNGYVDMKTGYVDVNKEGTRYNIEALKKAANFVKVA